MICDSLSVLYTLCKIDGKENCQKLVQQLNVLDVDQHRTSVE